MATAETILGIARKEIGYHEGKNKDNKFGKWYGLNNAAWCMIFCQWVYNRAGSKLPYKSASCSALLGWYKQNQPECVVKTPTPGCLVIFDLPNTGVVTDHVGLFESMSGDYITSIDGNTSSSNDANGGYVNRRTRNKKYIYAVIKPRELGQVIVTTSSIKTEAKKEEDEVVDLNKLIEQMTPEQAYKIYSKAEKHMQTLPLPTSWDAAGELNEAKALGITDASSPLLLTPRYQTAIMIKRAVKKA